MQTMKNKVFLKKWPLANRISTTEDKKEESQLVDERVELLSCKSLEMSVKRFTWSLASKHSLTLLSFRFSASVSQSAEPKENQRRLRCDCVMLHTVVVV